MARRSRKRPNPGKNKRDRYRSKSSRKKPRSQRKKPSKIKRLNWFTRKHPIATGVILIIASIVLFRISFTNTFLSSGEVFGWSILISIGLFLAGLLVLIGWWRNNISMLTTKHTVKWN